jgi:hypothetical protein
MATQRNGAHVYLDVGRRRDLGNPQRHGMTADLFEYFCLPTGSAHGDAATDFSTYAANEI